MFTHPRCLVAGLLISLSAFSGCAMFSESAWEAPSPLSGRPPPPPEKSETRGGFTVLVELPGQPTSARVIADIGAFAQQRGFVRQTASQQPAPQPDAAAHPQASPAPEHYSFGKISLEVTYDVAHYRVVARLHSFDRQLTRQFADQFFTDFRQQVAGRYGDQDIVMESDYSEDSGGTLRSGGGREGGSRRH